MRWPSFTQRAFLVKSIFTSKIRCPEALVQPGGAFSPSPSISKAMPTLDISFFVASAQKVLPFFLSKRRASSIVRGTSMPYLCVRFLTRELTADMITSRFLRVYGTHHAKAGSSSMFLAVTYSATSIGFDSLSTFNGIHCFVPSFHLIRNCQPTVV